MSTLAVGLVLVAAFIHAVWNFLLKRSGGGPGVVTAACVASVILYAPVIAVVAWRFDYAPSAADIGLMALGGAIHTAYFLLLDRAYRGGDLSVVYPLARATGPLLTVAVAVAVLGERPGPPAIAGAVLVVLSALLLTGNPLAWHRGEARHGIGFALLTGVAITAYTVTDRAGVAALAIPPAFYDWGCNVFRASVLVPMSHRRWHGATRQAWMNRRGTVIAIALLSPLSYILILTALVFTPVSLVAPAREVSILFAAVLGVWILREGALRRRIVAAIGMAIGVAGLVYG